MTAPLLAPTPVGEARWLLPREAYWSVEWFAREQRKLFASTWLLVGTAEDVDGGGLVTTIAGETVEIRRNQAGSFAAGNAAVGSWAGYVFANLAGAAAEPFEAWLGDVPARIGDFRPDRLVEIGRHQFDLACNWKLFVENHIDAYHLWYLHGDSLGAYDHPKHRWGEVGRHWLFYEPPRGGDGLSRGLRPIAGVGDDLAGSGAHLLFPNLPFATGRGFFMTYQCVPRGPERTTIDMRMRGEPGSDPTEAMALSRRIIEGEDGAACEAVQAGLRSPWCSVGPLARDHELAITRFQQHVLEAMSE